MIKSCTTGHNEVVWEHGNHPKGCPVCSQIARVQAAAFSGDTGVIDLEVYRRAISDAKYYACKLRDANIEIEKFKRGLQVRTCAFGHRTLFVKVDDGDCPMCEKDAQIEKLKSVGWYSNDVALLSAQEELLKSKREIERLKMCFHQQQSFGDIHLKMCREKDVEIAKWKLRGQEEFTKHWNDEREMAKQIDKLKRGLQAAWDRSLILKSIGPLEKSEVDVMKKDYFAMKKQRDELLVKVEELKNALDLKSRL